MFFSHFFFCSFQLFPFQLLAAFDMLFMAFLRSHFQIAFFSLPVLDKFNFQFAPLYPNLFSPPGISAHFIPQFLPQYIRPIQICFHHCESPLILFRVFLPLSQTSRLISMKSNATGNNAKHCYCKTDIWSKPVKSPIHLFCLQFSISHLQKSSFITIAIKIEIWF